MGGFYCEAAIGNAVFVTELVEFVSDANRDIFGNIWKRRHSKLLDEDDKLLLAAATSKPHIIM